jgi:hypothetical protein
MGGISRSGEKNNRPAGSAPVEYLQPDVITHGYELYAVFGWIVPSGGLLRKHSGAGQQS